MSEHLQKEVSIDTNESTLFPIIKPGDWSDIKYGAVYTILVGTDNIPKVVIGFDYDIPENFIFLIYRNSEKIDIDAAVEQAFINIDALDVIFTPSKLFDNKLLTASGLTFSSEAILSKKNLLKAHKMLNTKQLLVSIARRTALMVIAKDVSDELLNKFITIDSRISYKTVLFKYQSLISPY